MRFEWDEGKRLQNIRSHGIDFQDVPEVFDGTMLTQLDDRLDYGEDRWVSLGFMGAGVAVVVYTESGTEVIRIISARKADRHERFRFEQEIADQLGPPGGRG